MSNNGHASQKNEYILPRARFGDLLRAIANQGYQLIGPRVAQEAMIFAEMESDDALPSGYYDEQKPGRYQLTNNGDETLFSWTTTIQSIKPWLFRPIEPLWRAVRDVKGNWQFVAIEPEVTPMAFIGVRACDLAAIALQDQHFLHRDYSDPYYRRRRENCFFVAVNCTRSVNTCFCHATGDGPEATQHFDIALTEINDYFLLSIGSNRASTIIHSLKLTNADATHRENANQRIDRARSQQTRKLPESHEQHLIAHSKHKHWQTIAERCLACGNCTAVCPTCFCHQEFDTGDLNLNESTHERQWSSCFVQEHSYIHGLTFRPDTASRYRQWLTHKFATWHTQYGRSGCVGCGRCMSACPVAIDVNEELHELNVSTHA